MSGELTPREVEIARLVARGMTYRQITGELGIAFSTVKNHISSILRKTRLYDCRQLAIWALKQGIVRLDEIELQYREDIYG